MNSHALKKNLKYYTYIATSENRNLCESEIKKIAINVTTLVEINDDELLAILDKLVSLTDLGLVINQDYKGFILKVIAHVDNNAAASASFLKFLVALCRKNKYPNPGVEEITAITALLKKGLNLDADIARSLSEIPFIKAAFEKKADLFTQQLKNILSFPRELANMFITDEQRAMMGQLIAPQAQLQLQAQVQVQVPAQVLVPVQEPLQAPVQVQQQEPVQQPQVPQQAEMADVFVEAPAYNDDEMMVPEDQPDVVDPVHPAQVDPLNSPFASDTFLDVVVDHHAPVRNQKYYIESANYAERLKADYPALNDVTLCEPRALPLPDVYLAYVAVLDGLGVFAGSRIDPNTYTAEKPMTYYVGKRFNDSAGERISDYVWDLNVGGDDDEEIAIDARYYRGLSAFVNHSQGANFTTSIVFDAKERKQVAFFGVKDVGIDENDQLFINYGHNYFNKDGEHGKPVQVYLHKTDNWLTDEQKYISLSAEYHPNVIKLSDDLVAAFGLKSDYMLAPKNFIDMLNGKEIDENAINPMEPEFLGYSVEKAANGSFVFCSHENQQHITGLMLAAYLGHRQALDGLLEHGAELDRATLYGGKNSISFILTGKFDPAIKIQLLRNLERNGQLKVSYDAEGKSILHDMIISDLDTVAVEMLQVKGQKNLRNIELRDELLNSIIDAPINGLSGFEYCLVNGKIKMLDALLNIATAPFLLQVNNGKVFTTEALDRAPIAMIESVLQLDRVKNTKQFKEFRHHLIQYLQARRAAQVVAPVQPVVVPAPIVVAPVQPVVAPAPIVAAPAQPVVAPAPIVAAPAQPVIAPAPIVAAPAQQPVVVPAPVAPIAKLAQPVANPVANAQQGKKRAARRRKNWTTKVAKPAQVSLPQLSDEAPLMSNNAAARDLNEIKRTLSATQADVPADKTGSGASKRPRYGFAIDALVSVASSAAAEADSMEITATTTTTTTTTTSATIAPVAASSSASSSAAGSVAQNSNSLFQEWNRMRKVVRSERVMLFNLPDDEEFSSDHSSGSDGPR